MRVSAVALLSAALLAYQILLVRVFSITQFHHFASMAIGLAMLGFGAAGTWTAIAAATGGSRSPPLTIGMGLPAGLSAVLLLAGPACALRVPLDATQLPWDPSQGWRLAAFCLALAAPLVAGGLAVLDALAGTATRPGRVYGASFAGSAAGALLALGVLSRLPLERALAVPASLAAVAAWLALLRDRPRARLASLAVLLVAMTAFALPPWRIAVNPYKALPQVEAHPGARRTFERWSPLGWTVAVAAPSFRHAPGLSLTARGSVPAQSAVFVDGEIAAAVADWGDSARAFLDALPTSLPYALGGRSRVLVLGSGGNAEVWSAALHGAARVVAVELHPDVVRLARRSSPLGAEVSWVVGDARAYVAATRERFDLVTIPPGGGLGSSVAGLHALGESFLHTVEAYESYLGRLRPGGVLAVTCWLTTPPRESVRLVLATAEALRNVSAAHVQSGLIVCRSWGTVTVLVKPAGFRPAEVESLRGWAERRLFDLEWGSEEERGARAPFNALDDPALRDAARAATSGRESAARFARHYAFDVAPATDARPYPQHFLRLSTLPRFLGADMGRWLPFAEWGAVALVATVLVSALLGAALLLAPVAWRRSGGGRPRARVVGYFGAIGLAYLFAEIAALQPLALLLGHPVYAVSVLLVLLLAFSGVGSVLSDRLGRHRAGGVLAVLALALGVSALMMNPAAHALQGGPLAARALAAAAWLAPLAVLMGMPFPLGMRALIGEDQGALAWAWAANGFASVVAAPLAALISLETGAPAVLALSAAAYAVAAVVQRVSSRA